MAGIASSALHHTADVEGSRTETTDGVAVQPLSTSSDFCLFWKFLGVIDLDAEVPPRRLELGVPKQRLYGAQVPGMTVAHGDYPLAVGIR